MDLFHKIFLSIFIASITAVAGCANPYLSDTTNPEIDLQPIEATRVETSSATITNVSSASVINSDQSESTFETENGTVLAAIAGSTVGSSMDRHDQMMAQNAITDIPLYQETTWTNDDTGTIYSVVSHKEFINNKANCRIAKINVRSSNGLQSSEITLCRRGGKWYSK